MSWARTVSEWNKEQFWKDDLYGIPKKGGEYYDEVKAMMAGSTHRQQVKQMMGKTENPKEVRLRALKAQLDMVRPNKATMEERYVELVRAVDDLEREIKIDKAPGLSAEEEKKLFNSIFHSGGKTREEIQKLQSKYEELTGKEPPRPLDIVLSKATPRQKKLDVALAAQYDNLIAKGKLTAARKMKEYYKDFIL